MTEEDQELIVLGKIGRPHGKTGEVRLFLYNPESDTLEPEMPVVILFEEAPPRDLVVESIRYTDKFALIKFEKVSFREDVDALKHGELAVDVEFLPTLDDDEFYHVELLDLPVFVARDGDIEDLEPFGKVGRFFETGGANDVMVVERIDGSEYFVPMIDAAICAIDVDEERVVLWPVERWAPAEKAPKIKE
ncbi:MAG: ribosome maturation factor RimM [Bradymonadaceae bacterium]